MPRPWTTDNPAIHRLAVEQISVITGKARIVKAGFNEVGAQKRMTVRVRAWLAQHQPPADSDE